MTGPVKKLLSVEYGPATGGRMQIWHWLCSFRNWPEIVTNLQTVEQLDEGAPGRGTTLRLQWPGSTQLWVVSHWHPGQQLDLLRKGATGRRAYRIAIEESGDPGYYRLVVYFQVEYEGFWSFLGPLFTAIESKRAHSWLQQLLAGLSSLHAQI
jgi:hypothetical protein